jgi:hypothetical protein
VYDKLQRSRLDAV